MSNFLLNPFYNEKTFISSFFIFEGFLYTSIFLSIFSMLKIKALEKSTDHNIILEQCTTRDTNLQEYIMFRDGYATL
jgi:hypothetical protein